MNVMYVFLAQEYVEREDEFDIQEPVPDVAQDANGSDNDGEVDIDTMDEVRHCHCMSEVNLFKVPHLMDMLY